MLFTIFNEVMSYTKYLDDFGKYMSVQQEKEQYNFKVKIVVH